jgi:uncharacterized RDD family membrane protein YckC
MRGQPGTPTADPRSPSAPPPHGPQGPYGYISVPGGPLAPFGAPLAGWWQRLGSLLLDIVILDVPYGILLAIVAGATRTTDVDGVTRNNGAVTGGMTIAFFIIQALYFTLFNGVGRGQTPGNRAPGIAVRDVNTGEPIGAARGFLRWFVRILLYVVVIPGIVNDLLPLWSARRQTIADKAANSVMIRV